MEQISAYILSVACTAIICAAVQLLFPQPKGSHSPQQLVLGVIMTLTVMRPLIHAELFDWDAYFEGLRNETDAVVDSGVDVASQTMASHIIETTQTYILDKAASMGVQVEVVVTVCDDQLQIPETVTIRGAVSPYIKKQLTEWIKNELQIPEESQTWI